MLRDHAKRREVARKKGELLEPVLSDLDYLLA
jgi:hypothetical protein